MSSEQYVGELPSSSSYSGSYYNNGLDEKEEWTKASKDPTVWLKEATDAIPRCDPPSPPPKELDVEGKNVLDALIQEAYDNDDSCRIVYTGNGHPETPDERRVSTPDIAYTTSLAYSMAEDMCADNEIHNAFLAEENDLDVLKMSEFNGKKWGEKAEDNVAATYAVLYALGQRESSGNFYEGKDLLKNNTGIEEEVGFTQSSPNSLNLDGGDKTKNLLRNIFKDYVTKLSKAESQKEKADLCLSEKLQGTTQTKSFDFEARKLHEMFNDPASDCRKISSTLSSETNVYDKNSWGKGKKLSASQKRLVQESEPIINCFMNLHRECPAFSIKYGAAVTRINKDHHGPLRENQSKPAPRPACYMLFNSISANKEKICHEIKGPIDEQKASQVADMLNPDKPMSLVAPGEVDPINGKPVLPPLPVDNNQRPQSSSDAEVISTLLDSTKPIPLVAPGEVDPVSGKPVLPPSPADNNQRPQSSSDAEVVSTLLDSTKPIPLVAPGEMDPVTGKPIQQIPGVKVTIEIQGSKEEKKNVVQMRQAKSNKGADIILLETKTAPDESEKVPRPVEDKKFENEEVDIKIISRQEWDPGWKEKKSWPIGPVSRVTLHHTEGSNKVSDLNNLKVAKKVHVEMNGWSDIGYHFLVPREPVGGQMSVYEGAPLSNLGTHAFRNNTGNIGIALLGNVNLFHPTLNPKGGTKNMPTPYQEATVRKLVIMLKKKYANLQPITPHKYAIKPGTPESWKKWKPDRPADFGGQHTDCPGYGGMVLVKKLNAEGL